MAARVVVDFEDVHAPWGLSDGYGGISGWEGVGSLRTHYPWALGDNLFHGWGGSLTFDAASVVFEGLDYTYWGGDGSVGGFDLLYQGTVVHTVAVDADTQPASLYWLPSGYAGMVDEIRFVRASDGFIVDNLAYSTSTPVPEPETYALFAAGLGLLGALAWRRAAANPLQRPGNAAARLAPVYALLALTMAGCTDGCSIRGDATDSRGNAVRKGLAESVAQASPGPAMRIERLPLLKLHDSMGCADG
ncbi:MAG: PEP-CTERM sorting domain-containing protein [Pseudomonadota bacterium]